MHILFHVRDRSIGRLIVRFRLFFVGYVKAHVYTDKPASITGLEFNIEAFIREIPAEILERVCQNWTKRLDHLKHSRGTFA